MCKDVSGRALIACWLNAQGVRVVAADRMVKYVHMEGGVTSWAHVCKLPPSSLCEPGFGNQIAELSH